MMMLRNFVWGAILGVTIAVAVRPSTLRVVHVHELDRSLPRVVGLPAQDATTVVDVAANVSDPTLGSLVRLAPGETVLRIDDEPVHLDASTVFVNGHHGFLELCTSSGRRFVLLFH
jgi:hypothetical protein